MKHALKPRQEIGIRTVFNLLGPLTNPARASAQLVGLYRKDLTPLVAGVLKNLGCRGAFVVHGDDHCDEISITGKTYVSHLSNGTISSYEIQPEDLGMKRGRLEEIRGGDARENAKILLEIFEGVRSLRRDVVLLNAAAVFLVARKATDLKEGLKMAEDSIDSGRAMKKLQEFIRFSTQGG
jgi:anthranilate phosphoribosyltransferase